MQSYACVARALIAALAPVVTVVVALALRTERVFGHRIVAIVLGILATVLLLWPELELPDRGAMQWMLLMGVVPLCYGIEAIYVAAK